VPILTLPLKITKWQISTNSLFLSPIPPGRNSTCKPFLVPHYLHPLTAQQSEKKLKFKNQKFSQLPQAMQFEPCRSSSTCWFHSFQDAFPWKRLLSALNERAIAYRFVAQPCDLLPMLFQYSTCLHTIACKRAQRYGRLSGTLNFPIGRPALPTKNSPTHMNIPPRFSRYHIPAYGAVVTI